MKSRCRQALAFSENRRSAAIFCFIGTDYAGRTELRKRVRSLTGGVFSLNLSGDLPTRQGHKRVDTKVSALLSNHPL